MKKLRQYEIFKIPTDRFTNINNGQIELHPLTLTKREAYENEEVVKIQENQLTHKIFDYFSEFGIKNTKLEMSELIVNIVVPTEAKKSGEKEYAELAKKGFDLNGKHYVRLYSGSGQIRRNTITFIREDLYDPIFNSLLCGLTIDDFGNDFNAAKFNAYCGLNMSGCHLLPDELHPNVCVVDDFEKIRPHYMVNHVTDEAVSYITLPSEDYILRDDQNEYSVSKNKALRKSDKTEFTIHKGIHKEITAEYYDDIINSPALNSFDGQGLMSPEWAKKISEFLDYGYLPAELIIRAPWIKGLLVNIPFHEYFSQFGIQEVVDIFGVPRKIDDIDVIISKSQFKMYKIYAKKCCQEKNNAWDYYIESLKSNNLKWGIVKANNKKDDYEKLLNYQYLQAMELTNDEIDELCERTREFFEKLNSGSIEEIYKNLCLTNGDDAEFKPLFQKVLEINPSFINDTYIRNLILKECSEKINGAKLGKIFVRGNFQFCVSDPVAQMEWILRNHCNVNIEVKGVIPPGYVYSNYWRCTDDSSDELVLMRSPLIDRNEIAKRKLIKEENRYFSHLNSGIVYSIHDLTALQQGGCDFDGDIIFSTNNQIIKNGCYDFEVAKPLFYSLESTDLVGAVTYDNLIQADIRGLNSKVGTISNKGGALYAMLKKYNPESNEYKQIYNQIIGLGQIVGMEIDRIKTAVSPTYPLEWKNHQCKTAQTREFNEVEILSNDEKLGIYRHNRFVPDVKPYYFRYNYKYIDENIKQLERCFDEVSRLNFGVNLRELKELNEIGTENIEMKKLYHQFKFAYPVIDTDCVVNHVCHYFEDLDLNFQRDLKTDSREMLKDYNKKSKIDDDILRDISDLLNNYKRFKKLIAGQRSHHKDCNKSALEQKASSITVLKNYYNKLILEKVNNNGQLALDYIIAASNDEKILWELIENEILSIIRKESEKYANL